MFSKSVIISLLFFSSIEYCNSSNLVQCDQNVEIKKFKTDLLRNIDAYLINQVNSVLIQAYKESNKTISKEDIQFARSINFVTTRENVGLRNFHIEGSYAAYNCNRAKWS